MNYTFVPMNKEYAAKMVDTWKYENEYSITLPLVSPCLSGVQCPVEYHVRMEQVDAA